MKTIRKILFWIGIFSIVFTIPLIAISMYKKGKINKRNTIIISIVGFIFGFAFMVLVSDDETTTSNSATNTTQSVENKFTESKAETNPVQTNPITEKETAKQEITNSDPCLDKTKDKIKEYVASGDLNGVECAIKKGVNIKQSGSYSGSLMNDAIHYKQLGVVKLLIENGVGLEELSDEMTPLFVSAMEGAVEIEKYLIEKGANVNAKSKDEGNTPLMLNSIYNDIDLVRLLISKGAKVNAKANDGMTALSLALEYGNTDVVNILRKAGAK